MRWTTVVLFVATACRGEKPEEPSFKPEVVEADPPCPEGETESHVRLIARDIELVNDTMPLRWAAADKRMHELRPDPLSPIDLGPLDDFKAGLWDDRYWYTTKCFENCERRDSFGTPRAIQRIDRRTGARQRIGDGGYGFSTMVLFGGHVYWGAFPHGIGGGVYRVPKSGGKEELVRFEVPDYQPRISDLFVDAEGIFVHGEDMLGWIPREGSPRVLVGEDANAAVRDGAEFYVATHGNPVWDSKPSGEIRRIAGDTSTTLAGPYKWPAAITVHGGNVYFMLRETSDVYRVPKAGGFPTVVVKDGPRTSQCDESIRMWSDARGLFWLRGSGMSLFKKGAPTALYFLPWSAITSEPSAGAR
ncbi:MAG: hypothetical protein SFX73_40905 [Kofleriaceae bacterium]|nr:hypothetical protein [Kofleriaceae bacterium]